jgi:hypothetical protein
VERWSLLHDAHGARFGCMTTNLAESYNFMLRGNRALPLTAIVEGITEAFDFYPGDKVIWDPYSPASIAARYPGGLSYLCTRNYEYWLTKFKIVFDIFVEEMSQQRVMRQFNLLQDIVLPPADEPLLAKTHK